MESGYFLQLIHLILICFCFTKKLLPYSELQLWQLAVVSRCEYEADCLVRLQWNDTAQISIEEIRLLTPKMKD